MSMVLAAIAMFVGRAEALAHVKTVDHGGRTEYFPGATISAASRTHVVSMSKTGRGLAVPGQLLFENQGAVNVEFTIDAAGHSSKPGAP